MQENCKRALLKAGECLKLHEKLTLKGLAYEKNSFCSRYVAYPDFCLLVMEHFCILAFETVIESVKNGIEIAYNVRQNCEGNISIQKHIFIMN